MRESFESFNKGYKEIGKLGEGGFGEVFEVERVSDGSRFAKKVIKR